jgi:hypothetical protein
MKEKVKSLRRPSPAMVIAIVALVVAFTGTAIAGSKLGLGALSPSAKKKTVGVGKLTYVSTTKTIPGGGSPTGINVPVSATCPAGTHVIGGGIKVPEPAPGPNNDDIFIHDSYPTATGWAGRVANYASATLPATATTTAICAVSQAVTGAPPSS